MLYHLGSWLATLSYLPSWRVPCRCRDGEHKDDGDGDDAKEPRLFHDIGVDPQARSGVQTEKDLKRIPTEEWMSSLSTLPQEMNDKEAIFPHFSYVCVMKMGAVFF